MTTAKIIDGKAVAAQIREEIAQQVAALKRERPVPPGLAVILVGDDPASQVYVRSKERQAQEAGFKSVAYRRPADISEEQLITLIEGLNEDTTIDGILVQLPLPPHIDEAVVINAISPEKDVDGFHPINVGRLMTGEPSLLPCTPFGCIVLLKRTLGDLAGLDAVVVGRSNIVGKPMAALLLRENCTVTVAHSRTRNLPEVCRRADILVAAVGRPGFVKAEWIKPGATVIDVGINRVPTADGGSRLVGDVDFAAAAEVAGAITPVPGGVGPMTIAMLLRNTLESYCRSSRLACPLP
ncbi:bifunctional 5,10-methylene-tetrahydrofolate dehydrogenase and 5,10-methylene-tetrahydrofolate cyclohydrolase [uncultured Alphaproteobacteria bacterium]|uniref:Bifunctional protein FolD n=1 Tax=uncultured Alphaproteobacteria bacterium TaxID=91750 RepID=A0A212KJS0_9PROT|nr:bifunctional 5,10-methylene-tetrahydrofolate dehydrogenase and 5,10-methylene-tetrahydrofolate cyclohydrolase [uncultured Alphaproteobacteria bacterium]